jgi:hypothetical protein
MQVLTGDSQTGGKAHLVNSSMSGGNTVCDDPSLSGTAMGSPGIIPLPDVVDHLPLPEISGPEIPVSHPGVRDKVAVQSAPAGSAAWTDVHDVPSASRWTETS